jgi:AcrR family transcriptional regulator
MPALQDTAGPLVRSKAGPDSRFQKLRPGPGHPAKKVVADQQERLLGAMVELAAERGYRAVTVRGLSGLAGVSTKSFYKCFANIDECFGAAYASTLRSVLRQAAEVDGRGEQCLRDRVGALFSFLAENPKKARFVLIESFVAGFPATERGLATTLAFERLVDDGLGKERRSRVGPSLTACAVLGAGLRAVRAPMLADRPEEIAGLASPFSDWLAVALRRPRGPVPPVGAKGGALPRRKADHVAPAPIGTDRQFLHAAILKRCMLDGYSNLTVPRVRREAGMSRRSFDENFNGVEECFLSAIESLITDAVLRAEREATGCWEQRVVQVLMSLAGELLQNPMLPRLASTEILAPGIAGLKCREEIVAKLAERLYWKAPAAVRLNRLSAEASVAAIWRMAVREIGGGRTDRIPKLATGMAYFALAPAIGPEAAEHAILAELS